MNETTPTLVEGGLILRTVLLVMPRIFSGVIAFTVMIVFFDFLAILASFVSSYFTIDMTWTGFVKGMRSNYVQSDVFTTLIKASFSGFW